jgi:hypothetical protein
MSWVAVGAAAITVVGGYMSNKSANKGAKDAAKAGAAGEAAKIAEQQREFDITNANFKPFLDFGTWAIPKQQAYLNGDMSGFLKSADYLGAMQGQTQALDRSAAARGSLGSGGHQGDLMELGSRIANQYGNSYYDKLTGASNTGYNTANALGGYGAQAANNIGNSYANMGALRGSSYAQQGQNNADFWGGTANTLAGLYGTYMGRKG